MCDTPYICEVAIVGGGFFFLIFALGLCFHIFNCLGKKPDAADERGHWLPEVVQDTPSIEPDAADERGGPSLPEVVQDTPGIEPDVADERGGPSLPEVVQDTNKLKTEHVSQQISTVAWCLAWKMVRADGEEDERAIAIIARYSRADEEVPRAVEASPMVIAQKMLNDPEDEKVEALYLCARIAEADSKISIKEKAQLDEAAKAMRVDVQKFRTMVQDQQRDKASAIAAVLIGIQPDWSEADKRTHAQKEYEIWEPRTRNKKYKEEAEYKVALIAMARQRLRQAAQCDPETPVDVHAE